VGRWRKTFVSTQTHSLQSKQSGLAKSLSDKPGEAPLMEMGEGALTGLG